jgi:hypothetical protein
MLGDETRGLLQEAHSIRRYESLAPLGRMFGITIRTPARARSRPPLPARTMAVKAPYADRRRLQEAHPGRFLERSAVGPLAGMMAITAVV